MDRESKIKEIEGKIDEINKQLEFVDSIEIKPILEFEKEELLHLLKVLK